MVGEGYDCPDICVLGYASNILTEMFVCQVVARAQRVTEWERKRHQRPMSAQIIVPDIPELIEHFKSVLTEQVRDLPDEDPAPPPPPPRSLQVRCSRCGTKHSENRVCPVCFPLPGPIEVDDPDLEHVTAVTDTKADGYVSEFHDHDPSWIALLVPALEDIQLPGSDATAFATALRYVQAQRPFDEPVTPPQHGSARPSGTRPLSAREEADGLRAYFNKGTRYYISQHRESPDEWRARFVYDVKMAGGIGGKLDLATPEQLRRSCAYLDEQILLYLSRAEDSIAAVGRRVEDMSSLLRTRGAHVLKFRTLVPNYGRIGELTQEILEMLRSGDWREYQDATGVYRFRAGEFDYFLAEHAVAASDLPRLYLRVDTSKKIDEKAELLASMDPQKKNERYRRSSIETVSKAHPYGSLGRNWALYGWDKAKHPIGQRTEIRMRHHMTREQREQHRRRSQVKDRRTTLDAVVAMVMNQTQNEIERRYVIDELRKHRGRGHPQGDHQQWARDAERLKGDAKALAKYWGLTKIATYKRLSIIKARFNYTRWRVS